ncbi:hypothetical protein BSKO_11770 [Bryopsis sp. KO-2023]|nr:hypothetical protein BSKO_11770 [Bryopsis sp. KO-2023]
MKLGLTNVGNLGAWRVTVGVKPEVKKLGAAWSCTRDGDITPAEVVVGRAIVGRTNPERSCPARAPTAPTIFRSLPWTAAKFALFSIDLELQRNPRNDFFPPSLIPDSDQSHREYVNTRQLKFWGLKRTITRAWRRSSPVRLPSPTIGFGQLPTSGFPATTNFGFVEAPSIIAPLPGVIAPIAPPLSPPDTVVPDDDDGSDIAGDDGSILTPLAPLGSPGADGGLPEAPTDMLATDPAAGSSIATGVPASPDLLGGG